MDVVGIFLLMVYLLAILAIELPWQKPKKAPNEDEELGKALRTIVAHIKKPPA